MKTLRLSLIAKILLIAATIVPAQANLIISPTFDGSITGDPNAASIEATINAAIGIYEADFADPITVNITFQEGGGLGGSNFNLYAVPYTTFYAAMVADGKTPDDATALARLASGGTGTTNQVTGSSTILIKAATAHALGLTCGSCGANEGGLITLNTSLTNPGSSGSSNTYSLLAVAEHEIDEILGLGSTLGLGLGSPFNNDPSPEDFFRFTAAAARTFTFGTGTAFFSIDGTTDLAQFDNQNDGGDAADWQSNPLPGGTNPQVQDAFATPGSSPTLGTELRALDVIGYDLVSSTPEPASFVLFGTGLLLMAGLLRRRIS